LRPGLCPGPRWGSLQRSPRPPSWIKGGLLLRGGGGEGKRKRRERERRGKGRGGERRGGEGKGDVAPPPFSNSSIRPCTRSSAIGMSHTCLCLPSRNFPRANVTSIHNDYSAESKCCNS